MQKTTKYKIPSPTEMLSSGLHFGHLKRRWHPKMAPYIHIQQNGIHIFDLYKTNELLTRACDFAYNLALSGKKIIFVGTKLQTQDIIDSEAKKCGAMFITKRWLGGTFSNFAEVKSNRDRLKRLEKDQESGNLTKYTKKERLLIAREINKLRSYHDGTLLMDELPGAIFVVDAKREKTAVKEAIELGVPVIALIDSNTNPLGIKYPIPGNDDAIKAISLVVKAVADAVESGYKAYGESTKEVKVNEVNKEDKGDTIKKEKGKIKSPKAP